MNYSAFMRMWEMDGFHFVEHERHKREDATWILVTVLSDSFTSSYGRHFGITLALGKDEQILAHDIINLQDSTNPTQDTMRWFKQNMESGL